MSIFAILTSYPLSITPSLVPVEQAAMPCPLCGRSPAPFDVRRSALLDWIEELERTMHALKHTAQEVAL